VDSYCESLEEAEALARNSELGVHGSSARVRTPQQAGEQFTLAELAKETEGKKIKVIIQYCFDGGRYKVEEVRWRCHVCVCVCVFVIPIVRRSLESFRLRSSFI
jgi:hypothetical protein